MKKKIIIICILCIIGIFMETGCAYYVPKYKNTVLNTDSTDLNEVANQMITLYIDEFKEKNVKNEYRITDYTINKIKVLQGDIGLFQVYVDYSVKPSKIKDYSMSDGGTVNGDWVENKLMSVYIKQTDDGFQIISMQSG